MTEAIAVQATIEDCPMRFEQYAQWEAEALTRAAHVRLQIEILDDRIKVAESRLWVTIIDRSDVLKQKPPSVDAIAAACKIDPTRLDLVEKKQAAQIALLEEEASARGFNATCDALRMRSAHLLAVQFHQSK